MSNIIQKIFIDHYEEIVYTMHPRPVEIENIERMINCGDPSFGGTMYGCPKCGAMKFVPFRCHSRFCPSCGTMYARKRAEAMAGKLINCKHRHCVFTIPEELRHFLIPSAMILLSVRAAVPRCFTRNFTSTVNASLSKIFMKDYDRLQGIPLAVNRLASVLHLPPRYTMDREVEAFYGQDTFRETAHQLHQKPARRSVS